MRTSKLGDADDVKSFIQPSDATVAAVNAFAKANNLETSIISPNGDWISLTTSVGQANTLFGAKFEAFKHQSMTAALVRTLSISLPNELVGHVDAIHPTTSFDDPNPRLLPRVNSNADPSPDLQKRGIPASCNSTIVPECLQEIYGIPATPPPAKSATLLVTAYGDEWAQKADLSVSSAVTHICPIPF